MKATHANSRFTKILGVITAGILVLIPFHAFLTVGLAHIFGHYTALRLWKELLLAILVAKVTYILVREADLRKKLFGSKLTQIIGLYLLVQLIWGAVSYARHEVTAKALGYGWIVNGRFLVFFLVAWVIASQLPRLKSHWYSLLAYPASIVVVFGLMQYFILPTDFLKHVGYNQQTIFPYETINHNIHYIRIMSTLRGANPLGAYLIVVVSLAVALWQRQKKLQYAALAVAGTLALFLTFSRSAVLGLVLSIAVVIWLGLRSARGKQIIGYGGAVLLVVALGLFLALRHNAAIQNAVLHTDDHSKIATTSNEGHASALKSGLHDLSHEPLGRGPGTAGPASAYNSNKVRIAENYFVQVGQETGWIGLLLFLAINVLVAKELWLRRDQPLALGLFASLIGLSVVNLLSHAWADDTLAYVWWGLAGLALAPNLSSSKEATLKKVASKKVIEKVA